MVYLIGKRVDGEEDWQVQGVYENEATAIQACKGWNWFVMPIELNKELPEECIEAGYYPMNEAVKCHVNIHTDNSEGFTLTESQVKSIIEQVNAD